MVAHPRPLIEVLAEMPDFRSNRGKRHPLAAILALHTQIAAAVSTELAARLVEGFYWVLPKTAELGKATVALVAGDEAPARLAIVNPLAIYGSTALFGVASLGLASWLFSRKDF